ncbi:MAG TPA: RecX family transcriptional regulator [Solirubrobacterales bacterium]
MTGRRADAFEVALATLRRKERGTSELAGWLRARGYGDREVDAAIARLADAGELDDERFARAYAEDKRALRGWGSERIREGLAARGIAEPWIEAALSGDSEADQVARARGLLEARGKPLAVEADRARALGFLIRRGYGYEVAHEAIHQAAKRAA